MPYLIFPTRHEDNLAWNIIHNFLDKNGKVAGLVARINTDEYGLVSFFSEEPYMAAINKAGISYTIISKDEITNNLLIDALREANPQYALEL